MERSKDYTIFTTFEHFFSKLHQTISKNHRRRLQAKKRHDLVQRYVGTWQILDKSTKCPHVFTIRHTLQMYIDGKLICAELQKVTEEFLLIQDEYGYHLTIFCENKIPYQLYDEADNHFYKLFSESKTFS